MDLRSAPIERSRLYPRITPAVGVALLLSAAYVAVVAFAVVQGTILPTAFSNILRDSAGLTWLYVASGWRRERERIRDTDRTIDELIKEMRN